MDAIEIITHSDGCPACSEAIKHITEKIAKHENVTVVIAFEKNGKPHFHAPVSPIQFEKLNNQYKLLK